MHFWCESLDGSYINCLDIFCPSLLKSRVHEENNEKGSVGRVRPSRRFYVIANQVRNICRYLRPSSLESLALKGALEQLLVDFQKHHGLQVSQELEDVSDLFSAKTQIAVYLFFQECLTNAAKRGRATSVKVGAKKRDEGVCFICEDNGIGFDLAAVRSQAEGNQGIGLSAMEERARLLQGSFEITSARGKGTRINITLPPDKQQNPLPTS